MEKPNAQKHQGKHINAGSLGKSYKDLLIRLNLIEGEDLKRAAGLLFHNNPEKFITGSYIKIGLANA